MGIAVLSPLARYVYANNLKKLSFLVALFTLL